MAVYVAVRDSDGLVKIGTSWSASLRVRELSRQVNAPVRLLRIMDGGIVQERWMHDRFADLRVEGEWFTMDADMLTVEIPENCEDDDAVVRTSVPLTGTHRRKIIAAMEREGIKSMSDFLRFAALERARAKE